MKKKQLKKRIKELEASNRLLANINQNYCIDIGSLKSANRKLQARIPKTDCKKKCLWVN